MTHTSKIEIEQTVTPEIALQRLKEGNFRFINNMPINKDLLSRIAETKNVQTPYAVILSCMDSRVSSELVFDQGVGDVFSIRIAGNVVTDGVLGSLEYSTAVAGSKLILVLGHTNCGAIKGACDHVEMGHLSELLEHIKPALEKENRTIDDRTSNNVAFVNSIAKLNIENSVAEILSRSQIIKDLVDADKLSVLPAIYNVATGKVSFSGFTETI